MAEHPAGPLATLQQYRAAIESLEVWLARDPGAAEVARTLERLVRFEFEQGKSIQMAPRADGASGLAWDCSSPDIERKYLPSMCRR